MPKIHDMTAVDADFASTGPNHNSISIALGVPASTAFNCLADGPAWAEWLGVAVEWTSPEPFGIGTTRTVVVKGQTIEEYFVAWEPDHRMNFRFDRSTMPVSAFAEDYRVDATGDNSCELVWNYAYEWNGPLQAIAPRVFGAGFAFNGRRAFKKLKTLLESDPARFATSN